MDSLSSRRIQVRLSSALIAVILIVLFGQLPDNSLFWQELQNSGHTFLFAVVAVLVFWLLQNSTTKFQQKPLALYILAAAISLLVGVLTELVQLLIGSDSSATDVARDAAGIVAGLGLYASVDKTLKSRQIIKAGVAVLAICVFLAGLFPLVSLSVAYVQRKEALPVILDLTEKWSDAFVQTKNALVSTSVDLRMGSASSEKRVALVQFKPGIYPGISMIEPYPD